MNPRRWLAALSLTALALPAPAARAQQNAPHAGYVYPAGGRQGDTFQVRVGGQFLANVAAVYFSGSGVQARVVDYDRPLTPQQVTQLREKAEAIQKGTRDAAAMKEIAAIRMQLQANMRRNSYPILSESVILEVVVSQGAEPGERELKLLTPAGLSNPLVFCVGQLPEFAEPAARIEAVPLPMPGQPVLPAQQSAAPEPITEVTLPATVNGQIVPPQARPPSPAQAGQPFTPGDVDRFRFTARQGQQLVISAAARELMPYLADAVPGWFQATLALFGPDGKEVAYSDDYRFHPDPVIHCEIPRDGEYTAEIRDSIYRGREDFVYRISAGELPYITGIFPLGGRAGSQTEIEVRGWNLPAGKTTMDAQGKGPGVYPVSMRRGELESNALPFAVDTLPEVLEKEPNGPGKSAQRVTLPVIVNGRIDRPGDWDVFSFEGRAGDRIVAEVYARRLETPLDSVLKLLDASGRQLALNDDQEDRASGLNTHHADSVIAATLPAGGTYYIHLGDTQQKGGVEYAYRLRISPPRPDFELRVTPSSINAAGGMTVPIAVYAMRKDGFSGEIALSLRGAPRGFVLAGGLIPAGEDHVRLTLSLPPVQSREPVRLNLEGRAAIAGSEVVRQAAPAEDMMQAFAYHHLVPAKDLKVALPRRGPNLAALRVMGDLPAKIAPGGTLRLQVRAPLPPNGALQKIDFELSDPPEGIQLKETAEAGGVTDLVLECDAAKVKPGMKGNLIVSMAGLLPPNPDNPNASANRRRRPLGVLPAIPFEVIKR